MTSNNHSEKGQLPPSRSGEERTLSASPGTIPPAGEGLSQDRSQTRQDEREVGAQAYVEPPPVPRGQPDRVAWTETSNMMPEWADTPGEWRTPRLLKRSPLFTLVEAARNAPCPVCRSHRGRWCRGGIGYPYRVIGNCFLHVMRLEAAALADSAYRTERMTKVSAITPVSRPQATQERSDTQGDDHDGEDRNGKP